MHAEGRYCHRHLYGGQSRLSLPAASSTHLPGAVSSAETHWSSATVSFGMQAMRTVAMAGGCYTLPFASACLCRHLSAPHVLQTVFGADTHTRSFMQMPKLTGQVQQPFCTWNNICSHYANGLPLGVSPLARLARITLLQCLETMHSLMCGCRC